MQKQSKQKKKLLGKLEMKIIIESSNYRLEKLKEMEIQSLCCGS